MKPLKVQFHVHTQHDPIDRPEHTAEEMLDMAASCGYDVVAMTHHDSYFFNDEIREYAAARNILLIPGIEKTIQRRHVVIINATRDAEKINTFYDLHRYRSSHPDCLVIAPHPYYPRGFCLLEQLIQNINLFDAIEYSWFFAEGMNGPNKKAERIAALYKKPMLATSDNHVLKHFDKSFSLVHAEEKSWPAIRRAILAGKIERCATPLRRMEYLSIALHIITMFDIPHQFRTLTKKIIGVPENRRNTPTV